MVRVGTHLELTSSMQLVPRRMQAFHEFVSGAPQRLDHFQVVTHDVQAATDFWTGLGMRMSEYTATDGTALLHAADVAGSLGFGDEIDRGPGRHGISNALFLYLRDPDQHRVELFTTHYQFIDLEDQPIRWDVSNPKRAQLWGLPASRRWFFEASEFPGEVLQEPTLTATPRRSNSASACTEDRRGRPRPPDAHGKCASVSGRWRRCR